MAAGNSASRYAWHVICAACGVAEALRGFFWMEKCLSRGIALNRAGQAISEGAPKESKP